MNLFYFDSPDGKVRSVAGYASGHVYETWNGDAYSVLIEIFSPVCEDYLPE